MLAGGGCEFSRHTNRIGGKLIAKTFGNDCILVFEKFEKEAIGG